ncbi:MULTISPECIES: hypothetical protein [unclassified Streptomyces]|uniref:hypothetical protein n=1 Tax=unclassified Streptomyces TaxID=2593676 RepID=UPI001369F5CA|nr:hypothetical protein [Streptomyces sp. MnatMP-M77]MYT81408.1 hypothetical protein [Streptomyces sp. SID8364]
MERLRRNDQGKPRTVSTVKDIVMTAMKAPPPYSTASASGAPVELMRMPAIRAITTDSSAAMVMYKIFIPMVGDADWVLNDPYPSCEEGQLDRKKTDLSPITQIWVLA